MAIHQEQVLIIGGTQFIGRNLVEQLLTLPKYEITLFNRGITNPHLFKDANSLVGDRKRKEDLHQIFAKPWDYVIDMSCYFPDELASVLEGLKGNYKNYIFTSTCSVYDMQQHKGMLRNEEAPTLPCSPLEATDASPETYGKRKAACERLLAQSHAPYTVIRPALVYGQYDPTDRLYYWIYQCKVFNQLLLPEGGIRKFSMTYVHDLIKLIVASLKENKGSGVYNCISHPTISIEEIVDDCLLAFQRRPILLNASAHFLNNREILPWFDMPLWLQSDDFTFSNQAMLQDFKIKTTSFKDGLMESLSYFKQLKYPKPTYGIDHEKRQNLLNEYQKNE